MKFYLSRQKWNLYWMPASGKWEPYEPFPESSHLEEMLEVINNHKHRC